MTATALANLSIVDTTTCAQLAGTDKPFILALKIGENLFEGILKCANAVGLKSAMISGLGAVENVTLAYYNLQTKQYQTEVYKDIYELISMNGNISFVEGKRFIHIHAALGLEDHSVVGGHVMDATIAVAGEISIIPLSGEIHREYDERVGLKLLCPI